MAHTAFAAVVLTAAALTAWQLMPASARTTDATMRLTVSSGGACEGAICTVPLNGTFAVDIVAEAAPAEGYVTFQTELSYNNFLAHGGRYVPADWALDEFLWPLANVGTRTIGSNGVVNHLGQPDFAPPYPTSHYEGPLVRLTMRCPGEPSSSSLTLLPYAPDNDNASSYTSGEPPSPRIAAKVSPLTIICGEEPPAPTATPTSSPTTSTPVPPSPTPTPLPGETPAAPPGDVSCDGVENAIDAAFILQFSAGLIASLPCQAAGDLNGDGRINAIDAAIVLQSTL